MQNRVIITRITCLYASQPLSVVVGCKTATFGAELLVSMGSRHELSFCGCKTSWLASEKLVSMGPSPHVWFFVEKRDFRTRITSLCWWIDPTCGCCMQNSDFWTRITSLCGSQTCPVILCMYNSGLNIRITSLYGSQPSSVVFACKTAWLASESVVSMGPSPHVWFLDAKLRLLDPNNKSLWVPDITCRFVLAIQHD